MSTAPANAPTHALSSEPVMEVALIWQPVRERNPLSWPDIIDAPTIAPTAKLPLISESFIRIPEMAALWTNPNSPTPAVWGRSMSKWVIPHPL